MSFGTSTQDSRDPNSPQWGYLKVKDPDDELQYPAKDEIWNEYVLFVHDQEKNPINEDDYKKIATEKGGIKARTDLQSIMIPAQLTIDAAHCQTKLQWIDREQVRLERQRDDSNQDSIRAECSQKLKDLATERKMIEALEDKLSNGNSIQIPTKTGEPENTTLWVALIVGVR